MSVVVPQEPECPSMRWQEGGASQAVATQAGGTHTLWVNTRVPGASENGYFGLLPVIQTYEFCLEGSFIMSED